MHERDSGHRLEWPVVEEDREPAALVLLRGDQPVREPSALVLALLRLGEEAGVLDCARSEVGEHRRADQVGAVEITTAAELEHPDRPVAGAQRHADPARHHVRVAYLDLRGRHDGGRAGVEEAHGLLSCPLEDLVGLERVGDDRDRTHERLEEGGLCLEALLDVLVAPALGDDQVDGERPGAGGRGHEADRGGQRAAEGEPDRADDGEHDRAADEEPGQAQEGANR